jgi:hypothetical protein
MTPAREFAALLEGRSRGRSRGRAAVCRIPHTPRIPITTSRSACYQGTWPGNYRAGGRSARRQVAKAPSSRPYSSVAAIAGTRRGRAAASIAIRAVLPGRTCRILGSALAPSLARQLHSLSGQRQSCILVCAGHRLAGVNQLAQADNVVGGGGKITVVFQLVESILPLPSRRTQYMSELQSEFAGASEFQAIIQDTLPMAGLRSPGKPKPTKPPSV